jgi:hypothetical protein
MSGIPSWCRVGQRVVCINAFEQRAGEPPYSLPVLGFTYTISEGERGKFDGWYLRFKEISNPPHHSDGIEPSFYYAWFRPAVAKDNDAEVEAKLFNKTVHQNAAPVKALEPAE